MGFENGRLVRVVLRAVGSDGDQEVNTLHYDLQDVTLGDNDPQSLADAFRDDVVPKFKALYDSSWQIQPVIVVDELDPLNPSDPRTSWISGTAGAGTRTLTGTETLPRALCQVATVYTPNIGRRGRGRIFIGGSNGETDLNYQTWQTGVVTLRQQFIDAIPRQPDISGPGLDATANWCVYSRTARAANEDPYAPHVVSCALRPGPKWLRSREP